MILIILQSFALLFFNIQILRSSNKPVSQIQQEMIQSLTEQGDKYASSIEMERKNIGLMEEQIAIMRGKILNQRRAMGGVNASKENHYMIEKQIRILENRLDKSLIKFNEAITHNKVLREEIDELRRERVVFENVYRKMERELQERKKKMAEIIEVSNQAYEQRDTYQMEIAAIEQVYILLKIINSFVMLDISGQSQRARGV